MTDSEILAMWQGWKNDTTLGWCRPIGNSGSWFAEVDVPDYLNDDAAAMSLLDTLVEKGMMPVLRIADSNTRVWRVAVYDNYCDRQLVEITGKPTRREAVVAACLELIERETLSGKEGV